MKKNKDIKYLRPQIAAPDINDYHICRCGIKINASNAIGMCQHCRELDHDDRILNLDFYTNNYDDRLAAGFALISGDGYYGD